MLKVIPVESTKLAYVRIILKWLPYGSRHGFPPFRGQQLRSTPMSALRDVSGPSCLVLLPTRELASQAPVGLGASQRTFQLLLLGDTIWFLY